MNHTNDQILLAMAKRLQQPLDILVTRPYGKQQALMAQLSRLTAEDPLVSIHHCPLITIENHQQQPPALLGDWPQAENSILSGYQGVIFVSGQAIIYTKQQLSSEQWRLLLSQPLYCVGSQSAAQLTDEVAQLGLQNRVNYPSQMNSEGLLKCIKPKLKTADRWLILRGVTGRDYLQNAMQQRGIQLDQWHIYQSKPPSGKVVAGANQFASQQALWLVTSQQALMHLLEVTGKNALGCPLIVSSDRIALRAEELGFKRPLVAKDATDHSLCAAVTDLLHAKVQE
ncbi:MAG: uroporphyrinogen-III synthase [Enterobacterales bacterium]|nr:uroporphyrinogen-III synthase [Enterobacterales bacterium]